jgi:hypothetical protein
MVRTRISDAVGSFFQIEIPVRGGALPSMAERHGARDPWIE